MQKISGVLEAVSDTRNSVSSRASNRLEVDLKKNLGRASFYNPPLGVWI